MKKSKPGKISRTVGKLRTVAQRGCKMLVYFKSGKAVEIWKDLQFSAYLESKGIPAWHYWVALTDFNLN